MIQDTILGKFKQFDLRTSVTAMSCHFIINSIIKLKYFFYLSRFDRISAQLGRTVRTSQKGDSKNREIDWSYLFECLQRFDKFRMWSTGNQKRKLFEFAETCKEKLVKSSLEPLCSVRTKIPNSFWNKNHELENNLCVTCHFDSK